MKKHKNKIPELHQKAEELLKNRQMGSASQHSAADPLKLIHELEVHQIELEMQTEELKLARENEEAESEKFRLLATLTTAGIFIADKDGNYTYVNPAWCSLSGLTPEEAKGDGWLRGIYTDDRSYVWQGWKDFVKGRNNWKYQYRFQNRENIISHVFGTATPIKDLSGNITGFIGDNYNISEIKSAEKELQRSNQRFKNAMEATMMAWWEMDYKTGAIEFHKDKALMLGYKPEQFSHYSDFTKLIHPDDYTNVMEAMLNHIELKTPRYDVEYRIKNDSGVYIWFRDLGSISETDESGNPIKITGLVINISDRKLAEEKWRESEERYRLLSDQSGIGIGLYSKEGKILYFNNKALSNLGGLASDFIGKSISEVFDKESTKEYLKRFRKVIRSLKSVEYEDNIQTPSGDYWFLSNHTRVCSPTGELIGIQVLAHDITERKKMERRLEASAVELRALTQHLEKVRETERSVISRDLHDDLGQKLTSINMDLMWLKSRIGVQSKVVEKKFQQMQVLMNDTIDSIQKISFGLRPRILDDLGLQTAIVWQLREFSKSSGIRVKSFFSPKDLVIDNQISLAIFRIVQEALTNILRHSGATDVEIKIKSTKKIIQVLIRDNGKGIEQDQIENNKSFGLIGMRERVKANGGEIKITGNQGTGTEIFVKIPLKD